MGGNRRRSDDEINEERGMEEGALLMSPREWEGINVHEWKGSRIVWTVEKVGIVKHTWVCVCSPVNARSGKGREEMRKFLNDVNETLMEI